MLFQVFNRTAGDKELAQDRHMVDVLMLQYTATALHRTACQAMPITLHPVIQGHDECKQ